MTTKQKYTTPEIRVIPLGLGNEVLQHFNVTSDTIDEGDAKRGFFDETDEEEIENSRPWGDISY